MNLCKVSEYAEFKRFKQTSAIIKGILSCLFTIVLNEK